MLLKPIAVYTCALAFSVTIVTAVFATNLPAPYYTAKTAAFITYMSQDNFTAAEAGFSDAMKQGVSPDKLNLLWDSVVLLNGPFEHIGAWHLVHEGDKTVVVMDTKFKKTLMKLTVDFDAAGKISGYQLSRPR